MSDTTRNPRPSGRGGSQWEMTPTGTLGPANEVEGALTSMAVRLGPFETR